MTLFQVSIFTTTMLARSVVARFIGYVHNYTSEFRTKSNLLTQCRIHG